MPAIVLTTLALDPEDASHEQAGVEDVLGEGVPRAHDALQARRVRDEAAQQQSHDNAHVGDLVGEYSVREDGNGVVFFFCCCFFFF